MPTYRVTYAEDWSNELLRQSFSNATVLQPNASLSANGRIEVRSDEGDLFRIASGGRLYFEDTPEGRQPCVGSGLVLDQSQNKTVAASMIAEKKVSEQRSYRVATRRQSLRRPNMISMRLRRL